MPIINREVRKTITEKRTKIPKVMFCKYPVHAAGVGRKRWLKVVERKGQLKLKPEVHLADLFFLFHAYDICLMLFLLLLSLFAICCFGGVGVKEMCY